MWGPEGGPDWGPEGSLVGYCRGPECGPLGVYYGLLRGSPRVLGGV